MLSKRRFPAGVATGALALVAAAGVGTAAARPHANHHSARVHRLSRKARAAKASSPAATPVHHLVVIYQENVSFDHYFATYPNATNPGGEPAFTPRPGTPSVNGLNASLLAPNNPNSTQPFRLDRSEATTCDQNHSYGAEQQAFDGGLMDRFPETVGTGAPGCADYGKGKGLVMGYYDGNTVTALWNYAQRFAMSDNSYSATFGPSTVGALNLVAGQTHGVGASSGNLSGEVANATVIGDPQPYYDDCSNRDTVGMTGRNIGDLLTAANVTWGWFEGGFRPTSAVNGKAVCGASHTGSNGQPKADYIPHHEPFQYYASTANPHHLSPSSVDAIGHSDQANHQYDMADFWAALENGNVPAVSFLKAPGYQDGHALYSDPLLEQQFLVDTINRLQRSRIWHDTAVVIAYDDSDGWYDHQMGPIVNQSQDPANDALTGGSCGTHAPAGGYQDRCGYGPRQPLLVLSPYAKRNFVDHTTTDQASILRFIEDNWRVGRIGDASFDEKAGTLDNLFDFSHPSGGGRLLLDPATGRPVGEQEQKQS